MTKLISTPVMCLNYIWEEVSSLNPGWEPSVVTKVFDGTPQLCWVNTELISQFRP